MSDANSTWNERYKKRPMVTELDFTKKAADYLKNRHDVQILDIGCGDGRDAHYFAEQGMIVTGIDFSATAIERLLEFDNRIDARVMDILNMDFPDESFDAIYAHLSIHYFDDNTTDKVIKNIYRMLKPEGLFFVRCKSTEDPFYGEGEEIEKDVYKREYIRHFFSLPYLQEKLQAFQILEIEKAEANYDGHDSKFVQAVAQKL